MKNTIRLDFLDFAKGFAILLIVLFHYLQPSADGWLATAITAGGAGVHLFILVSGFGLALSAKQLSVLAFYRRRIKTILVPYFLVVITAYLANLFVPYFEDAGLYALGGHLLLYKMFDESIVGSFGYPFWFMSTIVQLYIAYPFLARLMDTFGPRRFLVLSFFVSVAYWGFQIVLGVGHIRVFGSFFLQYLWEFCLGMFLARHYLNAGWLFWNQSMKALFAIAAIGMTTMGILAIFGGTVGKTLNDVPASLGYFALCAICFRLSKGYLPFANRAISGVGSFSYYLYLVHHVLFVVLMTHIASLNTETPLVFFSLFFVFPVALGISYVLSVVFNSIKPREKLRG